MKGNVYIGYSTNPVIRYKATSGGVGSSIVKYLLENGKCDYALSFDWDEKNNKNVNSWKTEGMTNRIQAERGIR